MTDGEKMIWATAFSAAVGHGSSDRVAVKLATRAVQRFREIDTAQLPAPEREQVEAMRPAVRGLRERRLNHDAAEIATRLYSVIGRAREELERLRPEPARLLLVEALGLAQELP